jgi:hypothetical protein
MPKPRWGVRFTSDPSRDKNYLQSRYNDDPKNAKRGELFVNEPRAEIYYVGGDGIARRVGEQDIVPFSRINLAGIRDFPDDTAAGAATPPVPVGGMYRTGNVLKVRLS